MVVCPVCRSTPIKIKDGVDIREVVEKLKVLKILLRTYDIRAD